MIPWEGFAQIRSAPSALCVLFVAQELRVFGVWRRNGGNWRSRAGPLEFLTRLMHRECRVRKGETSRHCASRGGATIQSEANQEVRSCANTAGSHKFVPAGFRQNAPTLSIG
jgi:hypothetical protein